MFNMFNNNQFFLINITMFDIIFAQNLIYQIIKLNSDRKYIMFRTVVKDQTNVINS